MHYFIPGRYFRIIALFIVPVAFFTLSCIGTFFFSLQSPQMFRVLRMSGDVNPPGDVRNAAMVTLE